MGEVHYAADAVEQSHAEREQPVSAADQHPLRNSLQEFTHFDLSA